MIFLAAVAKVRRQLLQWEFWINFTAEGAVFTATEHLGKIGKKKTVKKRKKCVKSCKKCAKMRAF